MSQGYCSAIQRRSFPQILQRLRNLVPVVEKCRSNTVQFFFKGFRIPVQDGSVLQNVVLKIDFTAGFLFTGVKRSPPGPFPLLCAAQMGDDLVYFLVNVIFRQRCLAELCITIDQLLHKGSVLAKAVEPGLCLEGDILRGKRLKQVIVNGTVIVPHRTQGQLSSDLLVGVSGIITGKFPKQVFIDTNGVEWDLCVPDSNLDMLPPVGNEAKIYTYLQHTDQLMSLYGFASSDERSVFLDLLKVDGVGPKGAVKIMSAVSSSRLLDVLEKGDLEMLEKIPGVGKKTAGKMMLTLKGKLKISESAGDLVRVSAASPYADVVMSLASMGYDKKLVEQKVAQLVEILTNDSSFLGKGQKEREDILFRRAIVELA